MNNYNYYNDYNMKANENSFENDPYTSFVKGNSFVGTYDPYKNYKPMDISPTNEKEYALLLVQIYGFAAHDLTLYLDVNPNDSQAISQRAEYINMYNKALNDYESKYGPINLDSNNLNTTPWMWDVQNFPWEVEK